jgi:hypothetical protein
MLLFLLAITARHPAGICAGIGSNTGEGFVSIQLVMVLGDCRPGAPRFAFQASRGAAIDQMAKRVRRSLSEAKAKTDGPAATLGAAKLTLS